MFKQWSGRYEGFTRRRFKKNSRGGGEWPPLAASTIARRRKGKSKGKGKGKKAILNNTGILEGSLVIGSSKNMTKRIKDGIRYGIAAAKHPGGGLTVQRLAEIHQNGEGRVPKRTILVQPSKEVERGMIADLRRAVERGLSRGKK